MAYTLCIYPLDSEEFPTFFRSKASDAEVEQKHAAILEILSQSSFQFGTDADSLTPSDQTAPFTSHPPTSNPSSFLDSCRHPASAQAASQRPAYAHT